MPKTADPPNLVILIQAICTHGEKSARGGTGAISRNRVPEALKFPDFTIASSPLCYSIHRVYYGGRNSFTQPTKSAVEVLTTAPADLGGVSLAFDKDALAVFYQYSRSQGAPERYSRKVEAFSLSPGQWGRVLYNGRHSGRTTCWWYEKWVYNIGLFASPSLSVFVTTEPVKVFTQMAHLL